MLNVVVTETGPLFSLEEAKQHLRVDFDDDDALIETYADAAVSHVLQYCNLSTVPAGEGPAAAFRAAALMMLGDLYAYRETGQVGSVSSPIQISATAKALLAPYRWLRV
ncbi:MULTISPECIES: head-tail connector protein [unclassified Brevundimonas]|uniref:head-tail connector protein n=1 Tax=unclassified Brevundimonas TaxID=2622653 RepID=UPI0025BA9BB7|nr:MULTISPECIES: head-tail connector protein [unclassified Brevundimonas]